MRGKSPISLKLRKWNKNTNNNKQAAPSLPTTDRREKPNPKPKSSGGIARGVGGRGWSTSPPPIPPSLSRCAALHAFCPCAGASEGCGRGNMQDQYGSGGGPGRHLQGAPPKLSKMADHAIGSGRLSSLGTRFQTHIRKIWSSNIDAFSHSTAKRLLQALRDVPTSPIPEDSCTHMKFSTAPPKKNYSQSQPNFQNDKHPPVFLRALWRHCRHQRDPPRKSPEALAGVGGHVTLPNKGADLERAVTSSADSKGVPRHAEISPPSQGGPPLETNEDLIAKIE